MPGVLGRRIVVELMQKSDKSELFHGFWLGFPLHLKEGAYQHSHLADQTRQDLNQPPKNMGFPKPVKRIFLASPAFVAVGCSIFLTKSNAGSEEIRKGPCK